MLPEPGGLRRVYGHGDLRQGPTAPRPPHVLRVGAGKAPGRTERFSLMRVWRAAQEWDRRSRAGCGAVKGCRVLCGEGTLSTDGAWGAEAEEAGGGQRGREEQQAQWPGPRYFRGLENILISFKTQKEKSKHSGQREKFTP